MATKGFSISIEQLPFREQIEFFRQKVRLPSSGWTDIWQEQHSHGFIVAGATSDALVEDFYNAIRQAKEKGTGYAVFRQQFDEIVARHGWSYNGSPGWRSRVIYDTNMRTAYSAGRYKQMQAVKEFRPFWIYRHNTVVNFRWWHKAWDGIILPADDPWWNTHYAPNGWGCNCEVDSLSRYEAESIWTEQGKDGPDEAPEIEWEERVIGSKGSNPRVVRVPVGIDPGFAYNPGKAWLEPHTVPPLQGYDAVLTERSKPWPTGFTPPPVPTPTPVPSSYVLPGTTKPEEAVKEFLDVFGATMDRGTVFLDKAGSAVAITKSLFEDGKGSFKWLESPGKQDRLKYINLMARALIDPDEIWWNWEQDRSKNGNWRLRRRYLKAFTIEGTNQYAVAAFEYGKDGWTGSTVLVAGNKSPARRAAYFDNQRIGRLLYKK